MTREQFELYSRRDAQGRTRLHRMHCNMQMRCRNRGKASYCLKKGIKVAPEFRRWADFRDWALSHGYEDEDDLEIDRIDNDGDYSPSNCRFVTRKENSRNKSTNRRIKIGRTTKCLTEWCEIFGISRKCFYQRIQRGWDEISALTLPPYRGGKKRGKK